MPTAALKARSLLVLNIAIYVALAVLPVVAMIADWQPNRLEGVRAPARRPSLRFREVPNEVYQNKIAAWFQGALGLVGTSICIDNSILFRVFGETKVGSTVRVGEDRVLFIDDDINYFNKAGVAVAGAAYVEQLAVRLATLQRSLAGRGRALVPLIVPSKTSIYRDAVPEQWTAKLGDPRPTDVQTYQGLLRAFAAHGVKFVDGRALLQRLIAEGTPRRDLWRPEGRHWTRYSACLAIAEVVEVYGELSAKPLAPLRCQIKVAKPDRRAEDRDLLRLLNAIGVKPVERRGVTIEPHRPVPASGEPRPTATLVATSFGWALARELLESEQWSGIFLNYYSSHLYEIGKTREEPATPGTPLWREASFARDLYVLDLFEGYLMGGDYISQFLDQAEQGILAGEEP